MTTKINNDIIQFEIIPQVNESKEFIEIATDFSNPLDIVREAISNSYDAKAKKISIFFEVIDDYGFPTLKITIEDDGTGMDKDGLQSFFDLGNSLRRGLEDYIGEKGHGTKIYLNSKKIIVTTSKNGCVYQAELNEPFKNLYNNKIPVVSVKKLTENILQHNGTRIEIYGYSKKSK